MSTAPPAAPRTLPLRFHPYPGEALDSWIEAYAAWTGVPARTMLTALGLTARGAMPWHYTLALRPGEAETAAAVCGLDPEQLHAMTLQRYDGQVVRARTDRRSLISSLWWTRTSGSRFCPHCLAETHGRWPLRWRLTWSFACTRHQVLMLDACPGCGHTPRTRSFVHWESSAPTACRACRALLPGAPARQASDPVLAAQAHIDTLLGDVEAGSRAAARCPAWVTDLTALAAWLLRRAEAQEFARFDPVAPDAAATYTRAMAARARPATIPPRPAALVAALAAWARELTDGPRDTAIDQLRMLLGRDSGPKVLPPRGLRRAFYRLSAPVQGRILQALDQRLDHLGRIRYRSPIPTAALPDPRGTAHRARHLPQQLWPQWTIRLLPPTGYAAAPFRAAITDLILLAGYPGPRAREVAAYLHPGTGLRLGNTASDLARDGHDGVFAAICLLADYLDAHGSPIDYQRRREVITKPVIDLDAWRDLAFTVGAHPGQHTRLLQAQRHLHEMLTGADLTDPRCSLALRGARERRDHLEFAASLTTPLREQLAAHAQTHLASLGIHEPLTWEPPAELARGLILPGRKVTDLDLAHLRHLVAEEHRAPEEVAKILGTGIEHVRLALERLPREPRPWGHRAAPTAFRSRTRAETLLTGEFLEREYLAGGKSLQQIADENHLHRRAVTAAARAAGHPHPRGQPIPRHDRPRLAARTVPRRQTLLPADRRHPGHLENDRHPHRQGPRHHRPPPRCRQPPRTPPNPARTPPRRHQSRSRRRPTRLAAPPALRRRDDPPQHPASRHSLGHLRKPPAPPARTPRTRHRRAPLPPRHRHRTTTLHRPRSRTPQSPPAPRHPGPRRSLHEHPHEKNDTELRITSNDIG